MSCRHPCPPIRTFIHTNTLYKSKCIYVNLSLTYVRTNIHIYIHLPSWLFKPITYIWLKSPHLYTLSHTISTARANSRTHTHTRANKQTFTHTLSLLLTHRHIHSHTLPRTLTLTLTHTHINPHRAPTRISIMHVGYGEQKHCVSSPQGRYPSGCPRSR